MLPYQGDIVSVQRLRQLRIKITLAEALRRIGKDSAAKHQLEEAVFRLRILHDQRVLRGAAFTAFSGLSRIDRFVYELDLEKESLLADALVQLALCSCVQQGPILIAAVKDVVVTSAAGSNNVPASSPRPHIGRLPSQSPPKVSFSQKGWSSLVWSSRCSQLVFIRTVNPPYHAPIGSIH